MPVTALYVDDEERPNATLVDVERAVRGLDGSKRTLVIVELTSGRTLTIGGGPRHFVAEVAVSDTRRLAAINPHSKNQVIVLVVGGQLADYPERLCVSQEAALAAARTFVQQDGALDPDLDWSAET